VKQRPMTRAVGSGSFCIRLVISGLAKTSRT
jgi:hypothetical protein